MTVDGRGVVGGRRHETVVEVLGVPPCHIRHWLAIDDIVVVREEKATMGRAVDPDVGYRTVSSHGRSCGEESEGRLHGGGNRG